ncbi:MAG: sporulation protein YabP [Clostridia bacterium]|nr:sporulation protein YabP [Clostridia bacterium]
MPENAMHDLIVESRKKVTMTGIKDVESFDEETIVAQSECGEIALHGKGLKISRLSVESGDMAVEGEIDSVIYSEGKSAGSFWSRVLR